MREGVQLIFKNFCFSSLSDASACYDVSRGIHCKETGERESQEMTTKTDSLSERETYGEWGRRGEVVVTQAEDRKHYYNRDECEVVIDGWLLLQLPLLM